MSSDPAFEFLSSLGTSGVRPGLDGVRSLAAAAGNPQDRLRFVPGHPPALRVHQTDEKLRLRDALLGRPQEPLEGFVIVVGQAASGGVEEAEAVLGLGVALLGQRLPFPIGGGVVARAVGGVAFVEVGPRRCGDGDNQDRGGDEVFHGDTGSGRSEAMATGPCWHEECKD